MNTPSTPRKPGDIDFDFGYVGLAPFPAGVVFGESCLLASGKMVTAAGDMTPHVCLIRHLETGEYDPAFGEQGVLRIDLPEGTISRQALVLAMPDDSVLITASMERPEVPGGYVYGMCRLLPEGELDPDFGEGGFCMFDIGERNTEVTRTILLSDGKVAALASAMDEDGHSVPYIVRLADGRFDPTFGESGSGYLALDPGRYHDIAESADHAFLVIPRADPGYGVVRKYLENGNVDQSFGMGGQYILPMPTPESAMDINRLKVMTDGRVLLVGQANVSFGNHTLTMRLTPDGNPDPTFNKGEPKIMVFQGYQSTATDVAVLPDGKIVVVGNTASPGFAHLKFMRMDPDGAMDMSFGTNGQVISVLPNSARSKRVWLQNDRKVLISGSMANFEFALMLIRYLG